MRDPGQRDDRREKATGTRIFRGGIGATVLVSTARESGYMVNELVNSLGNMFPIPGERAFAFGRFRRLESLKKWHQLVPFPTNALPVTLDR